MLLFIIQFITLILLLFIFLHIIRHIKIIKYHKFLRKYPDLNNDSIYYLSEDYILYVEGVPYTQSNEICWFGACFDHTEKHSVWKAKYGQNEYWCLDCNKITTINSNHATKKEL